MNTELEKLIAELMRLWGQRVNEYGGLDNAVMSMSQALMLLKDAAVQLDHPQIARVRCVVYAGRVHALRAGETTAPLCGKIPHIYPGMTIYPRDGVPNCPDCLKMLKEQPGGN